MPLKLHSSSAWNRIIGYPQERIFKMFVGKVYANGYGRAEFLEKILSDHFKTMPGSEQEYLLRSYDEYFLNHLLCNWHGISRLTGEMIHFLYDKIKFRKVMLLNMAFDENQYRWSEMWPVFNEIFTACDDERIKRSVAKLPEALQVNIFKLAEEVRKLKTTKE